MAKALASANLTRRGFLASAGLAGLLASIDQGVSAPMGSRSGCAARLSVDNVALQGLNDVFPRPFEVELIRSDKSLRGAASELVRYLIESDETNSYVSAQPLEFVRVPKWSGKGWRHCAVMEVADTLTYLGLALATAPEIEAARSRGASPVIHSYRYKPSRGRIFDRSLGHASFLRQASIRRRSSDFVVFCDIANFYDEIEHTVLHRALANCGVEGQLIDKLISLLGFWMGPKGLPVGQQASRILSEGVLVEVDRRLFSEGIEYVRFVDDFRLFAGSAGQAEIALATLDGVLGEIGLRPNSEKTFVVGRRDPQLAERIPPPNFRYRAASDFRPPNRREMASLRDTVDAHVLAALVASRRSTSDLRAVVRRAVYSGGGANATFAVELMRQFPVLAGYTASALIDARTAMPAQRRAAASDLLGEVVNASDTDEIVRIFAFEVLAMNEYSNGVAVTKYAERAAVRPTGIGFRQALEALRRTTGIPRELYGCIDEADGWARRSFQAGLMS